MQCALVGTGKFAGIGCPTPQASLFGSGSVSTGLTNRDQGFCHVVLEKTKQTLKENLLFPFSVSFECESKLENEQRPEHQDTLQNLFCKIRTFQTSTLFFSFGECTNATGQNACSYS